MREGQISQAEEYQIMYVYIAPLQEAGDTTLHTLSVGCA